MGIYYAWTCDAKQQTLHILPHESCKQPMCATDTMAVLADLCRDGSWGYDSVRIVNDVSGDFFDPDDPFHHRPPPADLVASVERVNRYRAECGALHPPIPIPRMRDEVKP